MLSVSEILVHVYVVVDDALRAELGGKRLRQRGAEPQMSDAETLTVELVGEYLGYGEEKALWSYFHRHWRHFFPTLPSRSQFVRQAANLWAIKQRLHARLSKILHPSASANVHVVDAFPIRVCRVARAKRCRLFSGSAARGYCASQKEAFYGFKGHLLVHDDGVIAATSLTAGNVDDRQALYDLLPDIHGVIIGDKGYISRAVWWDLWQKHIQLKIPRRRNMSGQRAAQASKLQLARRKIVETVISQLTGRFNLHTINARDLWHLTSRVARKILAHTVCCFISIMIGNEPLQMDMLLASS